MAMNMDNDWSDVVTGDPMMSSSSGGRLLNGNSTAAVTATTTSTTTTAGTKTSGSEPELFSRETLDRSSPDLWPEQIPGVTEFVARSQSPLLSTYGSQSHQPAPLPSGRVISTGLTTTIALNEGHNLFATNNNPSQANRHRERIEWLGIKDPLTPEEMHLIQGFGSLNSISLYEKVRELQDLAYQLGLEESREMSRGTLLNVLQPSGHSRRRDNIENIQRRSRKQSISGGGRKQKLPTDKRLFFTETDGNQTQPTPPPSLMQQATLSQSVDEHSIASINMSMPPLQLIPNLDGDSNPSSPFRSLRSDPSLMR